MALLMLYQEFLPLSKVQFFTTLVLHLRIVFSKLMYNLEWNEGAKFDLYDKIKFRLSKKNVERIYWIFEQSKRMGLADDRLTALIEKVLTWKSPGLKLSSFDNPDHKKLLEELYAEVLESNPEADTNAPIHLEAAPGCAKAAKEVLQFKL